MEQTLDASWRQELAEEFAKPYFAKLTQFVRNAYATETVYPPAPLLFEAFRRTPFTRVKVVLLGQDPYHEPGQAQGLAFYVPPTIKPPPSLQNIAKEVGHCPDLLAWAEQGVLLLNTTLTVRAHQAGSHQKHGWECFTDAVVRCLAERHEHLVFLLWGAAAQRKAAGLDRKRHLILEAPHPSPLSAYRGFLGCNHFALTNAYLTTHGKTPIRW